MTIIEQFNICREDPDYDVDGFMKPQLNQIAGVYQMRLSAPGFMDCTDWEWVNTPNDVKDFFERWCLQEEPA